MKKFLMALIILVAFSFSASAQVPNPFSFYAGGLISLPNSPDGFKDAYKNGWHGYGGVGYKMMPNLQVVGKVEYHTFQFDAEGLGFDGISGGSNNLLMFGVDGRFSIGAPVAPVKPFVIAGGGFANISTSDIESSDPLATSFFDEAYGDQTKAYFNVGAGIDLKSGPMFGFFAQVRYVSVQTEGEASTFIPITLGVRFF